MTQVATIGLLALPPILAYFLSLTTITVFLPQLLALLAILFIIFRRRHLPYIYLISAIVSLLVFCTGAVSSPVFFLVYFLLFILAFQFSPTVSLSISLILILLLSQSLSSPLSLLPLFSLIFITPLVWFVSHQTQTIAVEETDFLLWLNLKFKTGIKFIIDESKNPNPDVKIIRQSAQNLLNSSDKLTTQISNNSDEI